jgi:hypothetical protein
MRPLEPVPGVKVTHRIHAKLWRIDTDEGVVVVAFDWRTGEMAARLEDRPD